MIQKYILDSDNNPIAVDLITWTIWYGEEYNKHDKGLLRVAKTDVGDYQISTVFLSIDHSWNVGKRLLFETLVWYPDGSPNVVDRYATYIGAQFGHDRVVKKIQLSYLISALTRSI